MFLIKKSFKSERRYQLIVRLQAIKYKENCLYYLFSTASFHIILKRSFP